MSLEVRLIDPDETESYVAAFLMSFGADPQPAIHARVNQLLDLERALGAFDDGLLVGTAATFSMSMRVPGCTMPMGGTTLVSVLPTHRRRGVLNAMMRSHLDDVAARGEPLAGLWASEATIYGRYGYGQAMFGYAMQCNAGALQFTDQPPGRVVLIGLEDALRRFPQVYDRVMAERPGFCARSDTWWRVRVLTPRPNGPAAKSGYRFAAYEGESGLEGYAVYQQEERWNPRPEGLTQVREIITSTDAAHSALWRYLASLDLFPILGHWNLPVDDELVWRLADSRALELRLNDSVWLRVVDVCRALTQRRYAVDGDIVFGLRDGFMPQNIGTYALSVRGGIGHCERTSVSAQAEMDIRDLGALYLGGTSPYTLARAGRIHAAPEVIDQVTRMFTSGRQPWCPEIF